MRVKQHKRSTGSGHTARFLERDGHLAFNSRLVDQHAGIGGQACEGEAQVRVEDVNLPHGPRLLELSSGFLLYGKHDCITPLHPNLKIAFT